jgi:hypothetical protein
MVEKPTQYLDVPSEAIREEEQKDSKEQGDRENHDDYENEEEQPPTILFTLEQLEVLLIMNRPNFNKLVAPLKGGSSKGIGFKPAKLGNFDGVQDRKVVDAWLAKMEDYFHATKIR